MCRRRRPGRPEREVAHGRRRASEAPGGPPAELADLLDPGRVPMRAYLVGRLANELVTENADVVAELLAMEIVAHRADLVAP